MKAYPFQHKNPTSGLVSESEGMDLRDYFAAKAFSSSVCEHLSTQHNWDNKTRAKWCYIQADDLLKAREAKDD